MRKVRAVRAGHARAFALAMCFTELRGLLMHLGRLVVNGGDSLMRRHMPTLMLLVLAIRFAHSLKRSWAELTATVTATAAVEAPFREAVHSGKGLFAKPVHLMAAVWDSPRQSKSGSRPNGLGSYHAQHSGTEQVRNHRTPGEPGGAVVVGAGDGNGE